MYWQDRMLVSHSWFPYLNQFSKEYGMLVLFRPWLTISDGPCGQITAPSKGGEKFHSWWYGMVLKSRHIKDLFKPASGMVIELYRNNLFDPMNIGNFASTFAYRNFLKYFFYFFLVRPWTNRFGS